MSNENGWREFQDTYPELAEGVLDLGSKLYEMGAETAFTSTELTKLARLLQSAPTGALQKLGLDSLDKKKILQKVFELGSELLIQSERTGSCR